MKCERFCQASQKKTEHVKKFQNVVQHFIKKTQKILFQPVNNSKRKPLFELNKLLTSKFAMNWQVLLT